MSKVRDYVNYLILNGCLVTPIQYNISSKNVKGFNFYLTTGGSEGKISKHFFSCHRSRDCLYPTTGHLEIGVNNRIENTDYPEFLCSFDSGRAWGADSYTIFQGDRSVNLHPKYNIPDYINISYSRYRDSTDYIEIINFLYWDNYNMNPQLPRVSIKKLEKLFENSDNLEQDVDDYLKKNLLDKSVQFFTTTVDHIFNCGVLDEIIDLVQNIENQINEVEIID